MPTKTDAIKTINVHPKESTSPNSAIHHVSEYDDSRGKNNIHNTTSGEFLKDGAAVNMKGAEEAHKNPASKPDQICRLPKKFVNFLTALFTR